MVPPLGFIGLVASSSMSVKLGPTMELRGFCGVLGLSGRAPTQRQRSSMFRVWRRLAECQGCLRTLDLMSILK